MSEGRSQRAASSFLFKLLESFGTQGIAFVVNILLARLLSVEDYGVLSMLTIFIAISQVFVQSGLNTALIQKKEVDDADTSSVFYTSLGIAVLLYAILFFAAPAIGEYFHTPKLAPALRVLALVLLPGALLSVQNAMAAREMGFRKLLITSLTATALSGGVGIGMALMGFGHWALVAQQLMNQCVQAVMLLFLLKWRPRPIFSMERMKVLLPFGSRLLLSSLLDTGYNKLRLTVIGRRFSSETLGYYNRGQQFPELMMNAVNGSIQSVMLPVLSEQQDDKARLKELMRRSVMVSAFLVLPMMAGLAAVAEPLVGLLLTDKWLMCVPFLQICCMDYAFYPIHTANLQAINAMGRSDVFLKLELIKKAFGLVVLAVCVWVFDSVYAIAWGAVASTLFAAFVNAHPNRKLLGYGYGEQIKDVLPSGGMAAVMFLVVWLENGLPIGRVLKLMVQLLTGIAVYGGLTLLLRPRCWQYLLELLKEFRHHERPGN